MPDTERINISELRRENDELRIRIRVAETNNDYARSTELQRQLMANWSEIHEILDREKVTDADLHFEGQRYGGGR